MPSDPSIDTPGRDVLLRVALGVGVILATVGLLAPVVRSHRAPAGPPPPDALHVEVLALRWSWRFRYAGPDGVFGTADDVTTLNDLRVPAGRAVALQVRSADVVHGFFLPRLHVRTDAFPGRTSSTWFRPARPGREELMCSVLCGDAHDQMRAEVTVLSNEEYVHWMNGWTAASRPTPDARWAWAWTP